MPSRLSHGNERPEEFAQEQPSEKAESDDDAGVPEAEYPSVLIRNIVVSSLMLAIFLIALDMSIIGTAIPVITTQFNSMADAGWYGSAFFLTLTAFISAWGKAYKHFSLRLVFLLALFIFEAGSLLCALAPNSIALICGRAIQGLGGAGISGGSYTITAFVCPPSMQPVVIGLMGSVFTVASVAGPLLGGAFSSSHLTWRWSFYINLPIGAVTMFCISVFFRTPKAAKVGHGASTREKVMSFDPLGLVLVFAAVLCFFLAIQWGGVVYSWSSSVVIGLLVGCVLLSVVFVLNGWFQGDRSLVVYRLLRRRSIGASAAFIFLNAGNIALQYLLPIYFQAIQGDSPVQSGIKMIPSILATALATTLGSAFAGRVMVFQPFLLAAGVIGAVGCGLMLTFDLNPSLGATIGFQVLFGVGIGIGVQLPNLVAIVTTTADDVAITISSVAFFMMLAGGWGVAVTDAALNNILLRKVPQYVPGLDGREVLRVGAAGLQDAYSGQVLQGVRQAYLDGIRAGLSLGVASFGVAIACALVPKWPGRLVRPTLHSDGNAM
ncbi:MFS general substrate transporter [Lentithecium fluviatile CBS 122367]|uniref:MFS general substrate transporter n=1 Tax=Lentithecium fluviatile CBS 122367 TaxID=1168545 RepID=A0A6G1J4F0_9PLEO|nr:MFS general substrate transporter [Lentithecium fluviatile CBS 122367]